MAPTTEHNVSPGNRAVFLCHGAPLRAAANPQSLMNFGNNSINTRSPDRFCQEINPAPLHWTESFLLLKKVNFHIQGTQFSGK